MAAAGTTAAAGAALRSASGCSVARSPAPPSPPRLITGTAIPIRITVMATATRTAITGTEEAPTHRAARGAASGRPPFIAPLLYAIGENASRPRLLRRLPHLRLRATTAQRKSQAGA